MRYPAASEVSGNIGLQTKAKFEEALRLTNDDVAAATQLVMADSVRELINQVYACGRDVAVSVREQARSNGSDTGISPT